MLSGSRNENALRNDGSSIPGDKTGLQIFAEAGIPVHLDTSLVSLIHVLADDSLAPIQRL
jgi:hypothetical protein